MYGNAIFCNRTHCGQSSGHIFFKATVNALLILTECPVRSTLAVAVARTVRGDGRDAGGDSDDNWQPLQGLPSLTGCCNATRERRNAGHAQREVLRKHAAIVLWTVQGAVT
jgi:hypothetical protein